MMLKMGSSKLGKTFFMPALVALRFNPLIIDVKERLSKSGKEKMVIVGTAMCKFIHIIYGFMKNGLPFDEKIA